MYFKVVKSAYNMLLMVNNIIVSNLIYVMGCDVM